MDLVIPAAGTRDIHPVILILCMLLAPRPCADFACSSTFVDTHFRSVQGKETICEGQKIRCYGPSVTFIGITCALCGIDERIARLCRLKPERPSFD
jgi:hypothetical protein